MRNYRKQPVKAAGQLALTMKKREMNIQRRDDNTKEDRDYERQCKERSRYKKKL